MVDYDMCNLWLISYFSLKMFSLIVDYYFVGFGIIKCLIIILILLKFLVRYVYVICIL